MKELLFEVDELLARLEDSAHGAEGDAITELRGKLQYIYKEPKDNDDVEEGMMLVQVPVGSFIVPPDLVDMIPISIHNEVIKKEYPIQDDIWPSRRWDESGTDYMDLSGEPMLYTQEELDKLLAEQHRNTRHDAAEAVMDYIVDTDCFLDSSPIHSLIMQLQQRKPI